MNILGIESSCDETSVAIVKDGREIIINLVASQISTHRKFGGVVPEVASRKHIEVIIPLLEKVFQETGMNWKKIEAIAVTIGPGLIGSLLIGLSAAKAMAYVKQKSLVPINHLEGHIKSVFLTHPDLEFPFIALIVSGGHTSLLSVYDHTKFKLLGATRDDAAGEAFDKVARFLHLGYPGGPLIDRLSKKANSSAIKFPRAYMDKDRFDFSFSGLKTSVFNYVRSRDLAFIPGEEISEGIPDIVASFQEAVVDVLIFKALRACKCEGIKQLVLVGGVACNSRLRDKLKIEARKEDIEVYYPAPNLCTDNAAMIAGAGFFQKIAGNYLTGKDIFNLNATNTVSIGK